MSHHKDRTAHVEGFTCGCYISRGYKPAKAPFPWGAILGYLLICVIAAHVIKTYL